MKMDKFSELKAAAMAATPGPWESVYDDWSNGDDALISSEFRGDGMVAIAKIEGGGTASGYDEPFSSEQQANTAFIAAANPAVVLELLAERDADKNGLPNWSMRKAIVVKDGARTLTLLPAASSSCGLHTLIRGWYQPMVARMTVTRWQSVTRTVVIGLSDMTTIWGVGVVKIWVLRIAVFGLSMTSCM